MSEPRAARRGPRPTLLWFRDDLRLADNAALHAAVATGRPVIACYVLDDTTEWALGGASRWWLHGSLAELGHALSKRGGSLILRRGSTLAEIERLAAQTHAAEVRCSKSYEPAGRRLETELRGRLAARGVGFDAHAGGMLFEPERIRTVSGGPFQVFTPFWRACLREASLQLPRGLPRGLSVERAAVRSEALDDWRLRPTRPDWAAEFSDHWTPGERGARARLAQFVERSLDDYGERRDRLDLAGTSALSPHLRFGEISPRTVWAAAIAEGGGAAGGAFLRELGWREFARHLLWHWPEFATRSFRPEFRRFPWRDDARKLRCWQLGATGYPIVDAALRQLWRTGWMHNRARMIAASFLVKHLAIPWQTGAAWFWDTLVDADLANNSVGWQWVAGSGADAAPYFRVFNPTLQGRKFDPNGDYVRRFVPELARLPTSALHEPSAAARAELGRAGVVLGVDYPLPIVGHNEARVRALASYASLRRSKQPE